MTTENTFVTTIKDSNLQNITADVSEIMIDSILKDGVFKEIPIFGTFINMYRAGMNIQDRLFLKKIISFLGPLNNISSDQRKKMIEQIDESSEYTIKVGEKLLYIIDECSDYESAQRISLLFKYFLEGHISYNEFLMTASVLQNMNTIDFEKFISDKSFYQYEEPADLLYSGLYYFQNEPISVDVDSEADDKNPQDGDDKYNTQTDGGVSTSLSRKGEIILEVFSLHYQKRKEEYQIQISELLKK